MSKLTRTVVMRRWDAVVSRAVQPLMRGVQQTRIDQFRTIGAVPGSVVFLGDSITEGGLWSEWFPAVPVANRGVSGETTEQIAARIDSAIDHPLAVFILAGTNDLAVDSSPSAIAERITKIISDIITRAGTAPIFLQSVMPRQAKFATEILDLNARLRDTATRFAQVEYVDLWPALATMRSALRPELTNDSLHLNGAGYGVWTDLLRPYIERVYPKK